MAKLHNYQTTVEWTGNEGEGTLNYKSYNRDHLISVVGKYDSIKASSDPAFLGDKSRYNPEELFLSSLSSCHMLWYLHLCATNNIIVSEYQDNATGIMEESDNGSGKFVEVTLNPVVTIDNLEKKQLAIELHEAANKMCFIANSCNFIVSHNPEIKIK
ncbi:OsmC family protein [Limibacter armeniacum]|uniref:OsmC family protein n=1 Tax=Limibacter armeniacum TaxID=466084 RepID=UPI002FE5005D